MTLKDLMKQIPEEHWDKIILMHLPEKEDPDDIPLIEVNVMEGPRQIYILLEADYD